MHVLHRKTCRVCGSKALQPVIDLGLQHLQGSFVKDWATVPQRKVQCTLVRCDPTQDENACGLLQMAHSVPPEILYSSYWYRSGTNQTMRDHLLSLVKEASGMVTEGTYALDIGCNDGTLLKCYGKEWKLTGVDPSNAVEEMDGVEVVRDVFPTEKLASRQFDVITSIAMFYDLEDPVGFAQAVAEILSPDGLWVVEMSYMPNMLKDNSYDTICAEHLEYYSLSVLEWIMREAGLKIAKASLNSSNGGSIRCHITHKNSDCDIPAWQDEMKALWCSEFDMELDTDKPYSAFQERVNVHRDELSALLRDLKKRGKHIHVLGASTKGNTILQWCGIDHRTIDFASDRNPAKHGAHTLGTDIPIISEAASRGLKPDFYLVLPWHFRNEILDRESVMLKAGTGLIFPLPKIEVIGGGV